jgi:hypothetical protein
MGISRWGNTLEIDMTQTAENYATRLFDESIQIGNIVWLPGAACGFIDSDFLDEVIFDLDARQVHPSMSRFAKIPSWAKDEEGFLDWLGEQGLTGFIAEVSTPIPTQFYDGGGYSSSGFGYTQHTHIYGDSLPEIAEMAIKWKDAVIEKRRAKGGAA